MAIDATTVAQLTCPTCGAAFKLTAHQDLPEPEFGDGVCPPEAILPNPWFMVCRTGHRWEIKRWVRSHDRGDQVALGDYLGPAEPARDGRPLAAEGGVVLGV